MKRIFNLLLPIVFAICSAAHLPAATIVDFNSPVPGTIADASGLGTGFTHRLPGTGTIYGNDPNMDLLANPGSLTIRSAVADTLSPQNFFQMETLGLKLPGIGLEDFSISALFRNIGTLNGQLMLYVGTDANNFRSHWIPSTPSSRHVGAGLWCRQWHSVRLLQ